MNEELYSGKQDKLDYAALVFLQVNRINQLSVNYSQAYEPGGNILPDARNPAFFNLRLGLNLLHSMIVWQLKPEDRKECNTRLEKIEKQGAEMLAEWFSLLMMYLPKAKIMPSQKRTLETSQD